MSNEITRYLENKGMTKGFLTFVSEFTAVLYEGLNTYGKKHSGSTIQTWALVLSKKQIEDREEILAAVAHFLDEGGELPTPGRFCECVLEQRSRQETKALLQATYEHEKALNEAYRQALIGQGVDVDALMPTREAIRKLNAINGKVKSLPNATPSLPAHRPELEDRGQALRVAEQIEIAKNERNEEVSA